VLAVFIVAALLVASCGDDDDSAGDADTTSLTSGAAATTTTTEQPGTATAPDGLDQPAIWPAGDIVFSSPQEAAEDFVSMVLGVTPALGEFRQGDNRSGEIDVFSLGEGDAAPPVMRSLLLLRRLGPSDGWFVLAAVNENASITSPESMMEVPAGPLTVEGIARGFEANVVVTAFVAGDAGAELERVVTQGGALENPEPFAVTLDLSAAEPGTVVVLLVRGGSGLESDPGDFGAIPVVIAD
jgi:hypothetical protein